eukprot:6180037-Pleurochrysis_carterae.AAC.2
MTSLDTAQHTIRSKRFLRAVSSGAQSAQLVRRPSTRSTRHSTAARRSRPLVRSPALGRSDLALCAICW